MFLNIIISVNMKYYTIYLPFTKREYLYIIQKRGIINK